MYFKTLNKGECCACTACEHACPTKSIIFKIDVEGFKYPEIDRNTCIDCGLCEKVCPIEHPDYTNFERPPIYAAKLKNIQQVKKSTSGGIFYLLAKHIIEKGGIVYGAAFDKNLRLHHKGVENMQDLESLRGSKYLQSNLEHIFIEINKQLKSGRWVYFVGTGCQVAGLKSFLRKKYDTLLTSDLVCHGVPSQKMFDTHLQYIKKKYHASKVLKYQFRDNERGIGCEIVDLENSKGKQFCICNPSYEISPYLYSFMYAMTLRPSCYECKFSHIPRQGDITLADYWGAKLYFPQMNIKNGVSLVLINNKHGEIIWNTINNDIEFFEGDIHKASRFNGNLINPTNKPNIRNGIYEKIEQEGYDRIAKNEFRSPQYWKIKLKNFFIYTPILKHIYRGYMYIKNRI